MRKYFVAMVLIISFFSAIFSHASAASRDEDPSIPLCPPGIYTGWEVDCAPLGPIQYMTDIAKEIGIFFPPVPLPIFNPDPSLSEINYQYASVFKDRAPIYATLDAAINNNKDSIVQRIPPGFNYVAYTDVGVGQGRRFFRTDKARSRQLGGSGIGLTIARHLAWAMGGELTVHSDGPGQGSSFGFTLPLI